ncbi:MAG: hypothetical protein KGM40_04750 [Betaproteobacteria bacterium]|nr:hypothetical protein [Betaproteobacteria bacterium]
MPNRRERWLILSHGFNMDGRAASLTITDKIPHLMEAGIEPIVLSAVTGTRDKRFRHDQLLPWGPAGFRFDLRHLLALRWGRDWRYRVVTALVSLALAPFILLERLLFGLQSQWSWMPAAVCRGLWIMRREKPALIYSTGGAYSAHWAGFWLKRLTGVRWIAEVHDPMVFPGTVPATRNLKFWARLEGMICREADLAWWFTDQALASARRRHPELGERGLVILPGAEPPVASAPYAKGESLILGHFGSLSAVRSLRPLVEAFSEFRKSHPEMASRLYVHCYGGAIDAPARQAIRAHGLEAHIVDQGRLEWDPVTRLSGRERIQQRMHQVDGLLLLHGTTADCAEYIPSKLYDYLWAHRPVVGLVHLNPQLMQLIQDHGGYAVEVDGHEQVLALLETVFHDWENGRMRSGTLPPVGTKQAVEIILAHTRWTA